MRARYESVIDMLCECLDMLHELEAWEQGRVGYEGVL